MTARTTYCKTTYPVTWVACSQTRTAVATAAQLKVKAHVLGMNGRRLYRGARRSCAMTMSNP
jgi:hypothetical protein